MNPATTPKITGYLYDGANYVQELNEENTTLKGTDASQASLVANLLTAGIDSTLFRQRLTATGTTITASTPKHLLRDANNNTVAITNAAATPAITTRYDYAVYGETAQTTVSGTPSDNAQQYTGRENDGTGLMYYRARYYLPGCARFISEDPIGWASGQTNNYAYVGGDPLNYRDPSGKFTNIIAGAIVGGLIGGFSNGFVNGLNYISAGCGFGSGFLNGFIGGLAGGAITGGLIEIGNPGFGASFIGGGISGYITDKLNQKDGVSFPLPIPGVNDSTSSSIVSTGLGVLFGGLGAGFTPGAGTIGGSGASMIVNTLGNAMSGPVFGGSPAGCAK